MQERRLRRAKLLFEILADLFDHFIQLLVVKTGEASRQCDVATIVEGNQQAIRRLHASQILRIERIPAYPDDLAQACFPGLLTEQAAPAPAKHVLLF